ncbi:dihydrofolate reductase family protein [Streptomyces sp. TRM66268-LWL]|uniref:Dihydrofolate reductase family protein n=1 Tax=Streptomyces polyasparticus TaxID=2767826 RepID=A0ABR7SI44_9ACTN|nr:dihydrofolate reductase family protein [Streptomyces polyasparticus]MBC9715098.1 dihydrofolate reductase family protein [Streptomyces polyasparticus]
MRKIILSLSVSLDGYFEGPGGSLDWHLVDEELHQHFNDQLRTMSAFLDGRVSHELMAAYWPTADANPEASPAEAEFAGIWRDMPKYVFSRTLTKADWNAKVLRRVDREEINALKAQPGGDMVIGGATIADEFRRQGLIDAYHLYVMPVILGAGRPLFPASGVRTDLRLVETRRFTNGVALLRYEAGAGDSQG